MVFQVFLVSPKLLHHDHRSKTNQGQVLLEPLPPPLLERETMSYGQRTLELLGLFGKSIACPKGKSPDCKRG